MDTAINAIDLFDHDVLASPLAHAGTGVLSALNSGEGSRLPSGGEESAARWFCGHLDELKNFLEARDATPGQEAGNPGRSVRSGAAFPGDVSEALGHGDFAQVWNDFKHVMAADPFKEFTETIQFTLDHAEIGPSSRVLDIGCSMGRHLSHLIPRSPRLLVGLDFDLFPLTLGSAAWAWRGLEQPVLWIWGDARRLPLRSGCLSHVNSFVTLSLLPVRAVLDQAARVLAPDGRLTITVEGIGFWWSKWETTQGFGRSRLARVRELLAYELLRSRVNWQNAPVSRRLAGHTVFDERTIRRIVERAGFEIGTCEVIRRYRGYPRLIALTATKREPQLRGGRKP
jgi:SAM-dependent methyltransferase